MPWPASCWRGSPDAQISFAGTARGIESRVVPREGFALDVIRSGGLKGKSPIEWATGLLLLPLGLFDAWRILSARRPHLVIGVGGYSSGPVVLVAAARGIPTMLLEQNAVPGLTNRLLAPVVEAAAVTFDSTQAFFGAKAFVSGNPVRPEFFGEVQGVHEVQVRRFTRSRMGHHDASLVRVLVFGGSQGAHAINVAMVEAAAELAAGGPHLRLTHQTGERDVEMVRAAYREAGLQADVEPFLYDMGRRLGQADLIVCRAGATTLAELTAAGKPAILVPLPTATDDHQRKNAEALASAGAADVLPQAEHDRRGAGATHSGARRGSRGAVADGRRRRARWRGPTPRRSSSIARWGWWIDDGPGPMLGKTRRVHFVGIGGIGMSGIAELLVNLGYAVTGSDEKRSPVTERLATLGIDVSYGHAAAHVGAADVVVTSSAVRPANPEVVEAARRQIPVIPRAEMLAELMRLRYAIAVAGSHGKTTTTSMIALVLERAGLDPTAVIGGRLSAFGSNARLGRGELMVAEADESDRSFLKLFPTMAVITNIDHEHLENYGGFDDLQQAFVDFANKVPFYGGVVACIDDPHLAAVVPRMTRRVTTYGVASPGTSDTNDTHRADITASDVVIGPMSVSATVHHRARRLPDAAQATTALGTLTLHVPGRHNLLNALATVAVGLELGLPFERIAAGLEEFRGAERRFDIRGEPNGILVVDDYGHHPTEIAAVVEAARALKRRIVVAFQPHRFTRTAALMDAFRPRAVGRRPCAADRHLRGWRRSDPWHHAGGAGRRDPAERARARRRAAHRRSCGRHRPRGSRGRRRDHARRRLDRRRRGSRRRGAVVSRVSAPADKRFRRAHVKPTRRRRWRALALPLARYALIVLVAGYALYRGGVVVAHARVLQIDHIVVRGNGRLSNGEVLAVLDGLRGENLMWTNLDQWRVRLLASPWVKDAALRRSLPSTVEVLVSERHPDGGRPIQPWPVSRRRPRHGHR